VLEPAQLALQVKLVVQDWQSELAAVLAVAEVVALEFGLIGLAELALQVSRPAAYW